MAYNSKTYFYGRDMAHTFLHLRDEIYAVVILQSANVVGIELVLEI